MKKILLSIAVVSVAFFSTEKMNAQTSGVLSFTFTEVVKSPTYNGNQQHDLAAWIQTNAGGFVKTKLRYVGGGTNDHLPTWAGNCGCTSSSNATGSACNKTDATTGATLSSFATRTFTWDAKNVSGTSNGTVVADGVYKVTIQSTWNHGGSGTATTSYTFTKGPSADHQTPANNSYFTGVVLDWQPAVTTGVDEEVNAPSMEVYPNPTSGVFNVDFKNANSIKVYNTLGVLVYEEKMEQMSEGTKSIDLSSFSNGVYIINISNGIRANNHRVLLNK